MNENIMTDEVSTSERVLVPSAFETIVYGGVTIGVLDGLAATVNAGIKGVTPDMVFHYIASALIGRDASYNGGANTFLLGVVMHFCVAVGAATGFYLLSRNLPILLQYPIISGPLYGIAVYFVMGWLIVPLTAAPKLANSARGMITGIVIHMIFVGAPAAFFARRFARTA